MARYYETESSATETESPVPIPFPGATQPNRKKKQNKKKSGDKKKKKKAMASTTSNDQRRSPPPSPSSSEAETEEEEYSEDRGWGGRAFEASWPRRTGRPALEGYVEVPGEGALDQGSDAGSVVSRTKSLTDDDLDELKGCLDLGFGFSYKDIPALCGTLPALELCYSMSRSLESAPPAVHAGAPSEQPLVTPEAAGTSSPVANWKISSPGDSPEEVKGRLKYWAQVVAATVRLCS